MYKLVIDTRDNKKTIVKIISQNASFEEVVEHHEHSAQMTLVLIKRILKSNQMELKDVSEIEVLKEHGSYTGMRVGVSIANALSLALGVPVNKKLGTFEKPSY